MKTIKSFQKTLAFLLLFTAACNFGFSQNKKQDVVYLHNGSMIRGQLIERIEGSHVKIETTDGSIWVFKMEEVKEIASIATNQTKKEFEISTKGFYNITDLGLLTGRTTNYSVISVSAQTVSGYRFSKRLAAGIGVGIESFDIPLAPLFAEGRYYLSKGTFSPFVALQAGYALPLENYRDDTFGWRNKGGITANANIGIRNYFTENIALVISVGFRHQQSTSKYTFNNWWDNENTTTVTRNYYNRVVFRMGILFN